MHLMRPSTVLRQSFATEAEEETTNPKIVERDCSWYGPGVFPPQPSLSTAVMTAGLPAWEGVGVAARRASSRIATHVYT